MTAGVRRTVDIPDLIERARAADPRAVGRLISLVESNSSALRDVARSQSNRVSSSDRA